MRPAVSLGTQCTYVCRRKLLLLFILALSQSFKLSVFQVVDITLIEMQTIQSSTYKTEKVHKLEYKDICEFYKVLPPLSFQKSKVKCLQAHPRVLPLYSEQVHPQIQALYLYQNLTKNL